MSEANLKVGRRAFLRGLGASVALPGLSSLGFAKTAVAARGVTASGAPLRMAFLYLPNGVIMDKWRPQGAGTEFAFNESMKPLPQRPLACNTERLIKRPVAKIALASDRRRCRCRSIRVGP